MSAIVIDDVIDLDRSRAVAGLLDLDDSSLVAGSVLPAMWHLAFFVSRPAQADIGADGHPLKGFPSPPQPGLRRMFAGGRVSMSPGLRIGAAAEATTYVVAQKERVGRSGPLTFVTTRTEVTQGGLLVLTDERDIVYRPPASDAGAGPHGPANLGEGQAHGDGSEHLRPSGRDIPIDITLLFRFSALTYNAHRIHYDRAYASEVEGYPGLVVHGPLQALLMAERSREMFKAMPVRMDYTLSAPLFEHDGLFVDAKRIESGAEVVVVNRSGTQTAKAQLTFASVS